MVELPQGAEKSRGDFLHLCCKQVTGFKDRLRRATLSTGTHAANTPQPHRASHPQAQKASPPLGSARVTRTGREVLPHTGPFEAALTVEGTGSASFQDNPSPALAASPASIAGKWRQGSSDRQALVPSAQAVREPQPMRSGDEAVSDFQQQVQKFSQQR
ncbi:hypothetical protein Purlil1_214 [Purpureocillium lilacinum]|uniref:Uncharacterized protein n=1 Tax=Purpureocillium lilacinum TaxID=33203 RepID=A0ABR0CII6_PURLI|nr:hypothetical protein Purlil1_214 [Purpureocillium lilacinum]